jgi:hypothetical protein
MTWRAYIYRALKLGAGGDDLPRPGEQVNALNATTGEVSDGEMEDAEVEGEDDGEDGEADMERGARGAPPMSMYMTQSTSDTTDTAAAETEASPSGILKASAQRPAPRQTVLEKLRQQIREKQYAVEKSRGEAVDIKTEEETDTSRGEADARKRIDDAGMVAQTGRSAEPESDVQLIVDTFLQART